MRMRMLGRSCLRVGKGELENSIVFAPIRGRVTACTLIRRRVD